MLESAFQKQVKRALEAEKKSGERLFFFVKEARSIRGLPDVIGCWNGLFFAMELKKSESESRKKTGRIVLQRYILSQIQKAGGFGRIVHPDNLAESLSDLKAQAARLPTS